MSGHSINPILSQLHKNPFSIDFVQCSCSISAQDLLGLSLLKSMLNYGFLHTYRCLAYSSGVPIRHASEGITLATHMIPFYSCLSNSSNPKSQLFKDGIYMISMNWYHFTQGLQISGLRCNP